MASMLRGVAMWARALPQRRCLSTAAFSRWTDVPQGPKDPILGVTEAFKADSSPRKLNLGVGAYRDDSGKPVVLESIQKASEQIVNARMDNEYLPIQGLQSLIDHALSLAYGEGSSCLQEKKVAAVQALSGTGALRLLGEFINRFVAGSAPKVYLPSPTWGNHIPIFNDSGLKVENYRYYDPSTKGLDLEGMVEDLSDADDGQVILLHACAHNPTGVDPSPEQWKKISDVCLKKGHQVIFDSAYQGFASGDPEHDAQSIRMFVGDGHDVMLAQSFSKNFGLYGQRVGCASILTNDPEEAARVQSQLKILARPMYSNPPMHGARIVSIILGDEQLKALWLKEVNGMASRIISMREQLRSQLEKAGSTLDWSHITNQIGMFTFTGMTPEQVEVLSTEHHIYMTSNGRISMAGLSSGTVEYLASAMHQVTKQ